MLKEFRTNDQEGKGSRWSKILRLACGEKQGVYGMHAIGKTFSTWDNRVADVSGAKSCPALESIIRQRRQVLLESSRLRSQLKGIMTLSGEPHAFSCPPVTILTQAGNPRDVATCLHQPAWAGKQEPRASGPFCEREKRLKGPEWEH